MTALYQVNFLLTLYYIVFFLMFFFVNCHATSDAVHCMTIPNRMKITELWA